MNIQNKKPIFCIALILLGFILCVISIIIFTYKKPLPWAESTAYYEDAFFLTREACRIGDNIVIYQYANGGWPKNIDMSKNLSFEKKMLISGTRYEISKSTIDNYATTSQIWYLARLYNATGKKIYLKSLTKGINYLLDAQYENGGWPQIWPYKEGYQLSVTFNDNAMVNVLNLFKEIQNRNGTFKFLDDSTVKKSKLAFDKGIDCILKSQIIQDGKLAVWCAQHDKITLEPTIGRVYELPSLSGRESVYITLLLMSVENPSEKIISAVEGAVSWFKKSKIKPEEKRFVCKPLDRIIYNKTNMWARFYELDTNRPIFSDYSGIKRYSIAEISSERRNNYDWYTTEGTLVLNQYKLWKNKNIKNKI